MAMREAPSTAAICPMRDAARWACQFWMWWPDAAVMDDVIELDDAAIRSAQDGRRRFIGEIGGQRRQEVVDDGRAVERRGRAVEKKVEVRGRVRAPMRVSGRNRQDSRAK